MLARKAAGGIEADARAALDQVAAEGVELRLVHGRADDTMLAATKGATLVVVGSHEKPRGRGTLLGSVATRLVHDAPCSVLVTRAADEHSFSTVDRGRRRWLASLAERGGGRDRTWGTTRCKGRDHRGDGEPIRYDERELERSGLAFDRSDAKPVQALVQASQSVDLLVVASRGLRGLRALGSVSERVAHQAVCSVLIVRLPAQE